VLPQRTGGDRAVLRPASAVSALRALAPSTIFQAPDGGPAAMRVVADVVRQVPAYELDVGSNIHETAALVSSLVAGVL
jgi:hypothetical protein